MRILVAIASVAVIAFVGYYFYQQWEMRAQEQRDTDIVVALANAVMQKEEARVAALDPAAAACEARTRRLLVRPDTYQFISADIGGSIVGLAYFADSAAGSRQVGSARCMFALGADSMIYLVDDPSITGVECRTGSVLQPPECGGAGWAGTRYPINPATTKLVVSGASS